MDFWFLMVAAWLLSSNCVLSGWIDEWKNLESMIEEIGELEIANEGIESLDRSIDMYDKLISLSVLEKLHEKVDKYQLAFSKEGADLLIDIKANLRNGADAYFRATNSIFQWCESAIDYLHTLKDLYEDTSFDQIQFEKSKIILLVLFDGWIEDTSGKRELSICSSRFNTAFEGLSKLKGFDDLSAEVKKYYEDLGVNVKKVTKSINETTSKLKGEIQYILRLKTQLRETELTIMAPRKKLLESIDQLIAKCMKYQARHQEMNHTKIIYLANLLLSTQSNLPHHYY